MPHINNIIINVRSFKPRVQHGFAEYESRRVRLRKSTVHSNRPDVVSMSVPRLADVFAYSKRHGAITPPQSQGGLIHG
jgi:hypothetical protein